MRKLLYLVFAISFFLITSKLAGAGYMASATWPQVIFAPFAIYALGFMLLAVLIGTLVIVTCALAGATTTLDTIRQRVKR